MHENFRKKISIKHLFMSYEDHPESMWIGFNTMILSLRKSLNTEECTC